MKKTNRSDSGLAIRANFKKGTINTLFTFSAKGCDEAMGFYWGFGDGCHAHRDHLGIPEQHQYKQPGNYVVTLEAFGTDNNLIASAQQRIKVERATVNEVVAKYKQKCMDTYKSSSRRSAGSRISQ